MENKDNIKYGQALRRVRRIKGFYKHLTVYVIINILIVILNISNLDSGESYFQAKNFFTLFFWGIGLFIHGFMVFGFNVLFGKNWEERKIKKFIEEDGMQNFEQTDKWE